MVLIESVSGSVILAHNGVLNFSRVHNNGNDLQVYHYAACVIITPSCYVENFSSEKLLYSLSSEKYSKVSEKDVWLFFYSRQSKTQFGIEVEQLQEFVQCNAVQMLNLSKIVRFKCTAVRLKHVKRKY
ncbi:hypothetical protein T07_14488 [Trichinella nelsoni]|uniref:Uncharacterized protein n=1 Tax=Trichinella nelsoni TaxID=6336 RepID=A0A0V0SGE8_9BILA|nr:hypothetical protein T07_14488 [Trichinella nelsoni]